MVLEDATSATLSFADCRSQRCDLRNLRVLLDDPRPTICGVADPPRDLVVLVLPHAADTGVRKGCVLSIVQYRTASSAGGERPPGPAVLGCRRDLSDRAPLWRLPGSYFVVTFLGGIALVPMYPALARAERVDAPDESWAQFAIPEWIISIGRGSFMTPRAHRRRDERLVGRIVCRSRRRGSVDSSAHRFVDANKTHVPGVAPLRSARTSKGATTRILTP